jgi:hypothetical protein
MTKRKVCLDENLPHDLRPCLPQFNTYTATYKGFSGLKNGKLLDAVEAASFDVLVTGDKTLHYEQNLQGRKLVIVSLSAQSWPVIEPHVDKIAFAIEQATPGSFTKVDCGKFSRKLRSSGLTSF